MVISAIARTDEDPIAHTNIPKVDAPSARRLLPLIGCPRVALRRIYKVPGSCGSPHYGIASLFGGREELLGHDFWVIHEYMELLPQSTSFVCDTAY